MNDNVKLDMTDNITSCKFTRLGHGFLIKLEGFPLKYIRLSINRDCSQYSIAFTEHDGWDYRVQKSEDGIKGVQITKSKPIDSTCT